MRKEKTTEGGDDKFRLVTQEPKPRIIGFGVLSVDEKGDANFFVKRDEQDEEYLNLAADMCRTRIVFAGKMGIMLDGFEQTGVDKTGRTKYTYQRWWLIYGNSVEEIKKGGG